MLDPFRVQPFAWMGNALAWAPQMKLMPVSNSGSKEVLFD